MIGVSNHASTDTHVFMHAFLSTFFCFYASISQVREVHSTHPNPLRRGSFGTAAPLYMPDEPNAGRQTRARVASAHEARQSTDVDCIVKATGVAPSYARCVFVCVCVRACVRACVRVNVHTYTHT